MLDTRQMEQWTGRWAWNAETAVFTDPHHANVWKSQTQDILVREGRLLIRNAQCFVDGSKRSWTLDGAFDATPRPITWDDDGSVLTMIGFFLIKPMTGADAFYTPDGSFTGSEYFGLEANKVSVRGSTTSSGKQYTYFEEWDRIG